MVELKTELAQVGKYEGYLVEIGYPDELGGEDEQTKVLDAHLDKIGKSIGKDNVYVRPLSSNASRNFLNHLNRHPDMETMPWLILLSQHPNEVEPGEEVLTLQLGNLDDEEEVIATLRESVNALNDQEFMRDSSPSEQAEWMQRALPYMTKENLSAAGSVVTLLSVIPL